MALSMATIVRLNGPLRQSRARFLDLHAVEICICANQERPLKYANRRSRSVSHEMEARDPDAKGGLGRMHFAGVALCRWRGHHPVAGISRIVSAFDVRICRGAIAAQFCDPAGRA
jgi:hypothetical protein